MRMAPEFEKANEIYFRLGIIYKQQQKFAQSLDVCQTLAARRNYILTASSASNLSSMSRLVL